MTFLGTILDLIKQIIIAFLKVNLSILTDLESYRNKLVFFTFILVVFIICKNNDYRVILSALGLLEVFICYYFNNRKIKDVSKEVVKNIIKKK